MGSRKTCSYMSNAVTVEVKRETWKRLNMRKQPGDSFDDVIVRMLDETAEAEA